MLNLTETAQSKVKELLGVQEIQENKFLRIGIMGGGCAGFQYLLAFDEEPREDDFVQKDDGFDVHINADAVSFIKGATLDYVDELDATGFKFKNPNLVAACGCGQSFRPAD